MSRGASRFAQARLSGADLPIAARTQGLEGSGERPLSGVHSLPLQWIRSVQNSRTGANPRRQFDDESIRQLAESIRRDGLLAPILVTPPDEDGFYDLVAGERRLRAATLLKETAIEAKILSVRHIEGGAARRKRIVENIQREALSTGDESRAVADYVSELGGDQKRAAQELGKSEAWVSQHMGAVRFFDAMLSKFPQLDALELSTINILRTIANPDLQREAIEEALAARRAGRGTRGAVRAHLAGQTAPAARRSAGAKERAGELAQARKLVERLRRGVQKLAGLSASDRKAVAAALEELASELRSGKKQNTPTRRRRS